MKKKDNQSRPCKRCGRVFSSEYFYYFSSRGCYDNLCKECRRELLRRRRKALPETGGGGNRRLIVGTQDPVLRRELIREALHNLRLNMERRRQRRWMDEDGEGQDGHPDAE